MTFFFRGEVLVYDAKVQQKRHTQKNLLLSKDLLDFVQPLQNGAAVTACLAAAPGHD